MVELARANQDSHILLMSVPGLVGSVDLSVFSTQSELLFPFLKSLIFKKLLFVEYPIFWDEGIQRSYYSATDSATGFYEFSLFLFGITVEASWIQWGQTLIPVRVLSQSYISRPSPSGFPRTEENNAVASSSRSIPNDITNLSATSGFIFPNVHSQHQQQQQSRSRTYSDPWNPTFTFGGTHGGSTTSGDKFLSPNCNGHGIASPIVTFCWRH